MPTNPFESDAVEQDTTRKFLCYLHNLSADKKGFDGMMPTDIYDRLELETVPRKDERVEWMVNNCLQRGYIKPVGDSGRINMTICGHGLCLSGEPSYCSKVSIFKHKTH
jgi:hypothetical protein